MTQIMQTMLLTKEAVLFDSCDSLFTTTQLANRSVIPLFPFLESVFEDLLNQLEIKGTITFHAVETKHPFLPGFYDYIFSMKNFNNQEFIQWQIFDATKSYENVKNQQQKAHEKKAFLNKKPSDSS